MPISRPCTTTHGSVRAGSSPCRRGGSRFRARPIGGRLVNAPRRATGWSWGATPAPRPGPRSAGRRGGGPSLAGSRRGSTGRRVRSARRWRRSSRPTGTVGDDDGDGSSGRGRTGGGGRPARCALQLHDHQRAQAEPLACITARMVSVPCAAAARRRHEALPGPPGARGRGGGAPARGTPAPPRLRPRLRRTDDAPTPDHGESDLRWLDTHAVARVADRRRLHAPLRRHASRTLSPAGRRAGRARHVRPVQGSAWPRCVPRCAPKIAGVVGDLQQHLQRADPRVRERGCWRPADARCVLGCLREMVGLKRRRRSQGACRPYVSRPSSA